MVREGYGVAYALELADYGILLSGPAQDGGCHTRCEGSSARLESELEAGSFCDLEGSYLRGLRWWGVGGKAEGDRVTAGLQDWTHFGLGRARLSRSAMRVRPARA